MRESFRLRISPPVAVTLYCCDCGGAWGEKGVYANKWFWADKAPECPECGSEDWEDLISSARKETK